MIRREYTIEYRNKGEHKYKSLSDTIYLDDEIDQEIERLQTSDPTRDYRKNYIGSSSYVTLSARG